jgi:N-acetyl-1-D-myo-inositol-2-amino-2-deoxy-alpha-D-glucopyranoside deacetylase
MTDGLSLAGAATDAAFARRASTTGTSFRRPLHGAIPDSVFQRWQDQRAAMGLYQWDPTQRYRMRGVPDDQIGFESDCRDVAPRRTDIFEGLP